MSIVQQLAATLEPWKTYYSDHDVVSASITAVHVAAIVIGGGLAIGADRMTLRVMRRSTDERALHARELHDVHRPVLIALAAVVVSGLLMAASDIEEFTGKTIFWVKMGLIVLLLINGFVLQKAESRVLAADTGKQGSESQDASALWRRIALSARISMTLWVVIVVVGIFLAS